MARFRAYSSDSSDDEQPQHEPEKNAAHAATPSPETASPEEEDESEEEESSTESTSDSDMLEDELLMPRKGEEHSDEDEEEDDEDMYIDEENNRASTSKSPPPPFVDRTIISRAQAMGMDAQRMHVMQTSLFRLPEETAALKAFNQPSRRTSLRMPEKLNRKHSRDSEGDGLRTDLKERASFAYDIEPPLHRPSRKYARVETNTSIFTGYDAALVDAGLAFGRSFRVGWGPGGTLAHLGSLLAPSGSSKQSANSSVICITKIPTFPTSALPTPRALSSLLQHQLTNSPIQSDDDGVPFATPSPSTLNFTSFAALFAATDPSYEASIFRLGQTLFDDINLHLSENITIDIRSRISSLARRSALSSWLEQSVAQSVESDLRDNPSAAPPSVAFTLLTGNQVQKAAEVAMEGGSLKLSTLIAQGPGDIGFRSDLLEQLELWQEQRVDVHIDPAIRKVYALLAGKVDSALQGSKGTGLEKCPDVDILENLDWKRVFGVCLWFAQPVHTSIAQVFRSYEDLTTSTAHGRSIAAPVQWYTERKRHLPSQWKLPPEPSAPDGLYSLIRLHADPTCSLSHIFNPLSFSPSPLDYSLPWHLYIILSRCMRVRDFADRGDTGIRDLDEEEELAFEGHSPSADLLTSSYAFQLEQMGMIQEALFVLLHIEGSVGRKKALKDLLARSATELNDWTVLGIIGSLKIPQAWVYEAQALLAVQNGQLYDAYELYYKAGAYTDAHDIAVHDLAPDAVIRQDLELLGTLFARFAGKQIVGWHVRGKVFKDYVDIMTRLPELVEQQDPTAVPDAAQQSEIDDLTRAVPRVIELLPDVLTDKTDVRHKVALNEMVSGLVKLMDRIRPFALSHSRLSLLDEISKLHIQSTVVGRFLESIQ